MKGKCESATERPGILDRVGARCDHDLRRKQGIRVNQCMSIEQNDGKKTYEVDLDTPSTKQSA